MTGEKLSLTQAVLVEGKYDKIRLAEVLDATILTTNGFSVFSDTEKCAMLRKIAEARGLVILTDSDPAGFVIRNKLKGMLPKDKIVQLYAPELYGKEKRKKEPSKAGILGVEGISREKLRELFVKNGIGGLPATANDAAKPVNKADLYAAGLCGRADSAAKRQAYCRAHDLPHTLSPNALLEAINLLSLPLDGAGEEN